MTNNKWYSVKSMCLNAIIAALYAVITIVLAPYSYMGIQFRISEILIFFCFWRPDFIIGLTLGCFIANIFSTLSYWDMLFGTLATFLSCLLIIYASPRMIFVIIYPTIINGLIVGAELYILLGLEFWMQAGLVALGEATVLTVGYFIFLGLMKNKGFMKFLSPKIHQDVKF